MMHFPTLSQRSLYDPRLSTVDFTALLHARHLFMSRLTPRHWIGFVLFGYAAMFIGLPGRGFGGLTYLETELGIVPSVTISVFLIAGLLEWVVPIKTPQRMFLGIIPQFVFALFSILFTVERYPEVPGAAPLAHLLVTIATVALLHFWTAYGRHDDE